MDNTMRFCCRQRIRTINDHFAWQQLAQDGVTVWEIFDGRGVLIVVGFTQMQ